MPASEKAEDPGRKKFEWKPDGHPKSEIPIGVWLARSPALKKAFNAIMLPSAGLKLKGYMAIHENGLDAFAFVTQKISRTIATHQNVQDVLATIRPNENTRIPEIEHEYITVAVDGAQYLRSAVTAQLFSRDPEVTYAMAAKMARLSQATEDEMKLRHMKPGDPQDHILVIKPNNLHELHDQLKELNEKAQGADIHDDKPLPLDTGSMLPEQLTLFNSNAAIKMLAEARGGKLMVRPVMLSAGDKVVKGVCAFLEINPHRYVVLAGMEGGKIEDVYQVTLNSDPWTNLPYQYLQSAVLMSMYRSVFRMRSIAAPESPKHALNTDGFLRLLAEQLATAQQMIATHPSMGNDVVATQKPILEPSAPGVMWDTMVKKTIVLPQSKPSIDYMIGNFLDREDTHELWLRISTYNHENKLVVAYIPANGDGYYHPLDFQLYEAARIFGLAIQDGAKVPSGLEWGDISTLNRALSEVLKQKAENNARLPIQEASLKAIEQSGPSFTSNKKQRLISQLG